MMVDDVPIDIIKYVCEIDSDVINSLYQVNKSMYKNLINQYIEKKCFEFEGLFGLYDESKSCKNIYELLIKDEVFNGFTKEWKNEMYNHCYKSTDNNKSIDDNYKHMDYFTFFKLLNNIKKQLIMRVLNNGETNIGMTLNKTLRSKYFNAFNQLAYLNSINFIKEWDFSCKVNLCIRDVIEEQCLDDMSMSYVDKSLYKTTETYKTELFLRIMYFKLL